LRFGRPRRKRPENGGRLPGAVSINGRPSIVDRRQRFCDWDRDTLVSRGRRGGLASLAIVAVTLHFWIDALFEVPCLVDGPAWPTYLVFALSLVFWAVLLWMWPSARSTSEPADG
jgi:hypothetical protein